MSTPTQRAELAAIAEDLTEACALLIASVVRAAGAENASSPEVNVEAKLYAAAVVIWSIRRPGTALGAEGGPLIDLWLAGYLAGMSDEDRTLFIRAIDNRTAQYVVLWEAGGDWALNTARFLDVNMGVEANAATLSVLADAAGAGRNGVDAFIQSVFGTQ